MDDAVKIEVIRAQRGDTRAFDSLVHRFQNAAVAYARTLLRDSADAEDAAQEAFVQAWRDLPRLSEPAAFGSWLRRIVFKFCDRSRRSARVALPLSEEVWISLDQGPASIIEHRDEATQVRSAINALSDPLREATLLYYFTGCDIQEIATFLELPPSTIKNRLHTARKRLRKELWYMAESIFDQEKPSRTETFAEEVLARVLRDFQHQEATDPHTVNRSLLDEGRTALFSILEKQTPLEAATVHDGFMLLDRKRDWPALSGLLMRYLTQPLSDSEAAWAYAHLANTIAIDGNAAGAVLAHEAFERWLPGKSPRLSAYWPFYPVAANAEESVYAGEDVRLLLLAMSYEFITSYLGVWRNNDYLAKVETVLAEIPVTTHNRKHRFFVLRMACNACIAAVDFDRANSYITKMHVLADGAEDEMQRSEIRARALGHDIDLARRRHDEPAFIKSVAELEALLSAVEMKGSSGIRWVRGQRHELACQLVYADRHELALPFWEANFASGGQFGGWGWLLHAATLWQVTHDRERTLTLLREAHAHDDRDMTILFAERPEFRDVHNDPEFLNALV